MASCFIDKTIYQNLSNEDLIKKQEEVLNRISLINSGKFPKDIANDLETVLVYIDEEIDKRLEDGRMDEDELDKDY